MIRSSKRNTAENLAAKKQHFLRYLGAKDRRDLYQNILPQAFGGDSYEDNIRKIFGNYRKEEVDEDEFFDRFLLWGEKKLDEAFNFRWKVAKGNTVGLFGAFGLTFANPIAGIAFGVGVTLAAGVAEGVAKRNIANFGHLQAHLSHKIHGCVSRMIEEVSSSTSLTDEAKTRLRSLSHPENKSKKSALARFASYFSGPVVSGVNNLVSRFASVSSLASGLVGTFIPFLPLITYRLSKFASNIRHKSALEESRFFSDVAEVLFDEKSWVDKDVGARELETLTSNFSQQLSLCDEHGRIPGEKKYHKAKPGSKDKNTNIKKGITFLPYLAAKVNRLFFKGGVKDIAQESKEDDEEPEKSALLASSGGGRTIMDSSYVAASQDVEDLQDIGASINFLREEQINIYPQNDQDSAPNVSVKTSFYSNQGLGYWSDKERANNFRALVGVYENGEDIMLTFFHAAICAANECGNQDLGEVLRVIEKAKKYGGLSNIPNDVAVDDAVSVEEKKLSKECQEYFLKAGLYSGRRFEELRMVNGEKALVGARLAFFPDDAIRLLKTAIENIDQGKAEYQDFLILSNQKIEEKIDLTKQAILDSGIQHSRS